MGYKTHERGGCTFTIRFCLEERQKVEVYTTRKQALRLTTAHRLQIKHCPCCEGFHIILSTNQAATQE